MFIRTQNKLAILSINSFVIETNTFKPDLDSKYGTTMPYIIVDSSNNSTVFIAKYSSLDKALKVLDMIEEHLNTKIIEIDFNGKITNQIYKADYVFQMPADEDVII